MAKIPITTTDPDEAKAEQRVREIMGPAQGFDGEEPGAVTEPDVPGAPPKDNHPANTAEQRSNEPNVGGDAAPGSNAESKTRVESDPYEKDLDMEQLPSDFKATTEPEDADTVAAVDDILKSDADVALSTNAPKESAVVMKPSIFERLKNAWFTWWDSPWSRYGTIAVGILLAVFIIFVKPVRNLVLNTFGVRSSVLVSVLDGATNFPLQNASVSADGVTVKTNEKGQVRLSGIRLGSHEVEIRKLAFAAVKKQVDFDMRITDLGEVTLKPTGQKLTFAFTDYLSGKPVADVSLTSGEATAKSDKKGEAILTIAPGSSESITVTKDGLRTEEIKFGEAQAGTVNRKLVPSARAIFISKASGKYDVYKVYVDGKDREVLLAGTGLETQAMAVLPKPTGEKVAIVSSRDDKRNKDGYLLSGLFVVDTETGEQVNIEYAEQITLIGWRGDTLLYRQTVAGASAANASRQKIIAYDFAANKRFQLANANYFAGEQLIGNTLYYTVSATDPNAKETFAQVNIDGTGKKSLYSGDAWALLRYDYTKLKFQTPTKWYEYTLGASAPVESTPPSEFISRYFVDSPDLKTSAWVDVRDSKGILFLRNLGDGKDTELASLRNMQAPAYWLGSRAIVYQVSGANEVADYVVSVDGGTARKIADVSLTAIR
ncbi:carboxypeptidase regulatory-like domain-containing protein [Candidatus Saccharibacteria bacterium]|nr:MAG: carboxypeptidase regulatory-like domain-containing protein [Candidatus Saccharibacteria bacterium]